eukprot:TRINITY_DN3603_c0_g1_i8.p1 TRINITY_DN3603_c0_g1~~TRINITY_DN3603_c0_g1_i8.p1  ORF type:complete len:501 (-),score=72.65 TRINITY_DN3603_c0_g1_i8:661-2163(-)
MVDTTYGKALAAYTDAASQAGLGGGPGSAGGTPPSDSTFANLVEEAGREAVDTMKYGEKMSIEAIRGDSQNLSEVVAAVNNAEVTLQTVVAIRDRVVEAYREIIQRSSQAKTSREAIRQQSGREMNPEMVTKLMEVINRRNSNGNNTVASRPHHSPSLSASLSDTQEVQTQRLEIIREDSQEAQIPQLLATQISEPVMTSNSHEVTDEVHEQLVTQISEPVFPCSSHQGEASDQLASQFEFDVQADGGILSHQLQFGSQVSSSPELMDSPRQDSLSSHPVTPNPNQQSEDQPWVVVPTSIGSVGSSVNSLAWNPQTNFSDLFQQSPSGQSNVNEVLRDSWQAQVATSVADYQPSVGSEPPETFTASEFSSDRFCGTGLDVQMIEDQQVQAEVPENWSSIGSSLPGDQATSEQLLTSQSISFHNIYNERQSSKGLSSSAGDGELCSICYERSPCVSIKSCNHEMCVECAFHLSHDGVGYPRCPFCRQRIRDFFKLSPSKPS